MSLFGATYGALGGQAAANEVSGQQKGWNFVENMRDQAQRRRIQQETWALESERRLQDIKDQQMKIFAKEQAIGQTGALTTENMQQIQEQQKRLRKQLGQVEADQIRGLVNRFLGSSAPAEELDSMNAWFEQHPEQAAKYGMKPGMKLMPVTYDNPYDRREVANYLMRVDPNFANLSKDIQDKYVRDEIASGTYVNAGGKVFNAEHFGAGIGATQTAPAEVKAKLARKNSGEAVSSKVAQSKMDGKQTSKATSEIAPIEEGSSSASGKSSTGSNAQVYLDRLKENEGFRSKAYKDTTGNWTIGYGHKIKPGEEHLKNASLSKEEAEKLLEKDAKEHYQALVEKEPWVADLPEGAKLAVADMAFNMGPEWMEKFPTAKEALLKGDYQKAADTILNSKYASQVGDRAVENAQLLTGQSVAPSGQYASSSPQQAAYGSSMSQPYRAASTLTKDEVLRNLAGWPDQRTAMMKNMDYVASNLGPDATLGDVMQAMQTMEAGGSKDRQFNIDRQLELFKQNLGLKYGPDWQNIPEARQEFGAMVNKLSEAQFAGKSGVRESEDVNAVRNWGQKFEDTLGKGVVTSDLINRGLSAEIGLPEGKDIKEAKKDLRGALDLSVAGNRIASDVLTNKEARSLWGQVANTIKQFVPGELMTKEQADEMINYLTTNTKLSDYGARYLKYLSGTAASDKERAQTFQRIGALFGMSPEATAGALRSFSDERKQEALRAAGYLGKRGFFGTAADALLEMGVLRTPDQAQAQTLATETPKAKAPQAGSPAVTQATSTLEPKDFKEVVDKEVMQATPGTKIKVGNCTYFNFGNGKIGKECK